MLETRSRYANSLNNSNSLGNSKLRFLNLQFALLAEKVLGKPELAVDAKFSSNGQRVKHRAELVKIITDTLMQQNRDHWLERFQGLG